jgi:GxxExxY protein
MTENEITKIIIECAIEVHRTLGPGLLEIVYEEALVWELRNRGLVVFRQVIVPIPYKGHTLGLPLKVDVLVERTVIAECKVVL